jgi:hypothetical protein
MRLALHVEHITSHHWVNSRLFISPIEPLELQGLREENEHFQWAKGLRQARRRKGIQRIEHVLRTIIWDFVIK